MSLVIAKLCIVFAVVIIVVALGKSMSLAVVLGSVATWLLYGIDVQTVVTLTLQSITAWSTLSLVLIMYAITFLQRMMVQKDAIERSRKAISTLFNNRWVNCAAAPIFIGLLPSPNAAYIAGDMVKASADGHLSDAEQAVTTSFFRHVSEAFLPTYSSILLALSLTAFTPSAFVVGMLPMVALLIVLGCFFLLQGKVPMATGLPPSQNKLADGKAIVSGLWPIMVVIFLAVGLEVNVLVATVAIIVVYFFVGKFKIPEILPFFKTAFERKIVLNTFAVMVFKDILTASGAIDSLPDFFAQFPIPPYMVFALIFFFGAIVSGSLAIVATCLPVAMVTVPGAGLPLLVLLMSLSYAAMQLSPTHICLSIVSDYFHITFGDIVKGTLPLVVTFCVLAVVYYNVWILLI